MIKKLIIVGIVIYLAITVFIAYQQNLDIQQDTPTPLTDDQINFFHYFSGALSGGIDEMVTKVNNSNQDYSVIATALDHEAFKAMIITSLSQEQPPELFSYWAGERVRQLVDKDLLMPIDSLWENNNLSAKFSAATIDSAVTYNGKKYLLPITQHIVVIFYNTKIFNTLGLSPPQSWPEFLKLCTILREHGITPLALGAKERWPAQFWFDYLLLRTAGPEYRTRLMNGEQSYTDNEVKLVYKQWAELLENGYFNGDANQLDWTEAANLVKEGKAAMTLMGTWVMQFLENEPFSLKAEKDYDFFPFPDIDRQIPHVSVGPIDGVIISRNSENHNFATKLLAYFAGQEAQEIMSNGSGALAPSSAVPIDFYSPIKQRLKKEISRSSLWAFNYDLATPTAIAERGMNSFNELIEFPQQYETILLDLQQEIEKNQNVIQQ